MHEKFSQSSQKAKIHPFDSTKHSISIFTSSAAMKLTNGDKKSSAFDNSIYYYETPRFNL